jgi:predicted phage-related endonuclease
MHTVSTSIGVSLRDSPKSKKRTERRYFIGGSDAHIIMGKDEDALLRLWREKRGEIQPEDLSGNLIVQLGVATEDLNRRWYEANTGQVVTDIQKRFFHPAVQWMAATVDGRIEGSDAVFEAKFMLLGGSGGREIHAPATAQYVGGGGQDCGPLDHYRRRQMGRDHHPRRSALPAPYCHS